MSLQALRRDPAGEPEGLLVLLHGRGTDERDLFTMLDEVDPQRRLIGVTPRAPLPFPEGGWCWYQPRDVGFPEPESFRRGFEATTGWLETLQAATGFGPERTILGGFSQGAAMTFALSLFAGRPRPAAVLALSGFVPTVPGWELDLSAPLPPFAIGHGLYDPVISVDFGRQARRLLEGAGAELLYAEPPVPHTVDLRFLAEASRFLLGALPDSP